MIGTQYRTIKSSDIIYFNNYYIYFVKDGMVYYAKRKRSRKRGIRYRGRETNLDKKIWKNTIKEVKFICRTSKQELKNVLKRYGLKEKRYYKIKK